MYLKGLIQSMGNNLSAFLQWQPNVSLIQKMGWPMAFRYVSFLGGLYYFFRAKEKRKIIEAIQEDLCGDEALPRNQNDHKRRVQGHPASLL